MLIRIYAHDAHKIAKAIDEDIAQDLAESTASWNHPQLHYDITPNGVSKVHLVKMRIGGTTRDRRHHYFILFDEAHHQYVMDLISEHCDRTRCYYILPQ